MRILFLVEGDAETWQAWSGIGQSVVTHLRVAGHNVITGNVDLRYWHRWLAAAAVFSPNRRRWGVKYRLLPEPARRRSRNAARHIRANQNIDLIFQIGASFRPIGRGNVPYVLYCDSNIRAAEHGLPSGYSPAQWLNPNEIRAIAAREEDVYRGAALIFTTSELLRQSFIADFGIPEGRVITAYGGPNFDLAAIPPRDSSVTRAGGFTILFVGGQFERKGGDVLVDAFRRVRQQAPEARLVLVGPDKLSIGEPGIEWLGYLDKSKPAERKLLEQAYSSADVFCLPSRFEPTGFVFFEAMAYALPCIGTHNSWGAIPEVVIDGETGFTVPVNDVDTLAERLLQLRDPELARTLGARGREHAETRFSWDSVVRGMLGVIEAAGIVPSPTR
jgi:glycosyltransferase involved in cell wall biosynthesis